MDVLQEVGWCLPSEDLGTPLDGGKNLAKSGVLFLDETSPFKLEQSNLKKRLRLSYWCPSLS